MSTPDPLSQQLSELSACAHRLGMAFAAQAERAEGQRLLDYFQLFDRCFFAVRVATALQLRLRREGGALRSGAAMAAGRETPEHERPEHEPPERLEHERPEGEGSDRGADLEYERDRERETERASLPLLLKTLGGIAADAAAMPGPEPAALPTLRELLAGIAAPDLARNPAPTAAPTTAPLGGGLRARLAGSSAAAIMTRAPPLRPGLPVASALRRATGPPPR